MLISFVGVVICCIVWYVADEFFHLKTWKTWGLIIIAIVGYAFLVNSINVDSVESDYNEGNYTSTKYMESKLWEKYIGTWVYDFALQPDPYVNVAGHGGSVCLIINADGTVRIIMMACDWGQERVLIDYMGEIEMDGNVLKVPVNESSFKFILKDNSVYTASGEKMDRKYY